MMDEKVITPEMLDTLRERVSLELSENRYSHTLGVEREIARLCEIYCPRKSMLLRAAALLHDITKEYSSEEHLEVMKSYGIDVSIYERESSKTYHSLTASLLIPDKYADYAEPELLHAVSVHTAGCADMTLSDKLLYLADYIEDTRTFEDCVSLRNFFYEGLVRGEDKLKHLDLTLLLSFDMTLQDLIERGKTIFKSTVEARNSLLPKENI